MSTNPKSYPQVDMLRQRIAHRVGAEEYSYPLMGGKKLPDRGVHCNYAGGGPYPKRVTVHAHYYRPGHSRVSTMLSYIISGWDDLPEVEEAAVARLIPLFESQ